MKKIKVGLVGSSGRMGQEIVRLIELNPQYEIHCSLNRNVTWDKEKGAEVDVWIDFSSPEALPQVLKFTGQFKKPIVCGTTGLGAKEKKLLNSYSKKMPLLWSSNMSLGVALLNEAIKVLAAVSHFDFQVEEIHHIRKKDKPSGTAITLQENLSKVVKKGLPEPVAIRGGGVFGVHKVYAMSEEEVLVFEHGALNRTVFARGAIQAAGWMVRQRKPGLYCMHDVLFGKKVL